MMVAPKAVRRPRLRRRPRDERGNITLFVVTIAVSLFMLVGLVVDGGGKIRALQRANTAADEAARSGGQAIIAPRAIQGDGAQLDLGAARAAAQQYLSAAGVEGQVELLDGNRLRVTTKTTYKPIFLSLVGVDTLTTSGDSTVRLVEDTGSE